MNRISHALFIIFFAAVAVFAQTTPNDKGWPRKFAVGTNSVAVYQPQIEEWVGNRISARAALAITQNQSKQPLYGVLWFTTRAEIDKVNRLVTLSEFKLNRINIPMAPDKAAAFEIAFQARADKEDEVISLDRLLADMAINHATTNSAAYEVKNDPPQVIFSTRPATLVMIDGTPVFRPVTDTKLERVINTRVLLLQDKTAGKFYLHLLDGWLQASSLSGPWTIAGQTSGDLKKALDIAAASVAYAGTRAAWANPYTENVGYGGAYTGVNTVTGTRYAARGGTNTNVYTGTTVTGGAAAAYNPNTGRISVGQAGTASNVYTGNSAAGARGATYNPQTGVISGGAVGGVRNGSTGQVTAGGGGFAYNTRTDTGVAVGNNNVYASKNGDVYRYNKSTGVQQKTSSGWETVQRSADRSWVQNQERARGLGEMRTRDFSSLRGNLSAPRNGGGFRRR